MAQREFRAVTSSSNYEVRLTVDYNPNATADTQPVTLQMWIRKTDGTYNRYRHTWGIDYIVDWVPRGALWYTLPDTTAAYLTMVDDQWYAWGPAHYVTVHNDGNNHTFGCTFACVGTIPKEGGVSGTIAFPKCTNPTPTPSTPSAVIPATPQGVSTTFDEQTRVLKYYIGTTGGANYFTLHRDWINDVGDIVKSDYLSNRIVYSNIPLSETLPDNIVKVTYQITAYSVTGHSSTTGHMETTIPSDPKVWVKVGSSWKKAIAYVKVNGKWKKAVPYVKVNGKWKKTML